MKNYISSVLCTIDNCSSLDEHEEHIAAVRKRATSENWKNVVVEARAHSAYGDSWISLDIHGQRPMTATEINYRDDKDKRDSEFRKEQDLKQLAALKKLSGDK